MNTHRHNALAAILARIDKQIAESDRLLLMSLSGRERHLVTDELAYLQIEAQESRRQPPERPLILISVRTNPRSARLHHVSR